MTDEFRLILASGSPRRHEMLTQMGLDFQVYVSNVDETRKEGELPEDYVARLAREKAKTVQVEQKCDESSVILAADTIVVQNERVYGKPQDYDHAKRIWQSLSGTKHQVITAVSMLYGNTMQVKVSVTDVEFTVIHEPQMKRYWATGEPLDKAGAYAIQGLAASFIKRIEGSYSGIMGLPIFETAELLRKISTQDS